MFKQKTSCSQYVEGNKRYIYQDQTDMCCFCMHRGVLKPDWIKQSGGEWIGYEYKEGQFYNSYKAWVHKPYASVYNLYSVQTGIQASMYRPDFFQKKMIYDQSSYKNYIQNPQMLELPQKCKDENINLCPGDGIGGCSFFRQTDQENPQNI